MNLIDIISSNQFLKKLYPDGLNDYFIGRLELSCFDRISIILHCKQRPDINVPKWGIWDIDYNVITIELLGTMINKLNVFGWEKNCEESCQFIINKVNNDYQIEFWGKEWKIELELKSIIFQRNSTYILDNK